MTCVKRRLEGQIILVEPGERFSRAGRSPVDDGAGDEGGLRGGGAHGLDYSLEVLRHGAIDIEFGRFRNDLDGGLAGGEGETQDGRGGSKVFAAPLDIEQ